MELWKLKKYFCALTGTRLLAAVALLFLLQPPAFSMQMWEQLLEAQIEEANNGDAEAQYGVGIKYLKGQGVKQDSKVAISWLERAAASGHEGATDKLARLRDQQKQFKKLLSKAEAGSLKAQYQTGIWYLKGKGVKADGNKARSWIGKAAEQGDRKAITRLGILYLKGEGGAVDYARALKNFNGVSNESVLAQYYLGEMYAGGKGVDKNYTTAISWYKKAADGGFDRAGGKIINMQEELRMEERRKKNAARKAATRSVAKLALEKQQTAAQQVTAAQQAAAKKVTTQRKKQAQAAAAARKATAQRKKQAAAAAKKVAKLTPLEELASRQWLRKTRPVEYLPSKVTGCEMEAGQLVCFSDLLTRTSGITTLQYRVKSEVKSGTGKGVFYIAYRNLVLDVVSVESGDDDDEPLGYDDEIDKGFQVQTGWTQDHKVECKLNADSKLDCVKDQTHKMVFVSN